MRASYWEEVSSISFDDKAHPELLLTARRRFFLRFDDALQNSGYHRFPLANPEAAKIIQAKLHEYDGDLYELLAYCIMPNHVHLLISLKNQIYDQDALLIPNHKLALEYRPLHEVMRRIKGATARAINQLFDRTGNSFWQKDSYDHFIRNSKSLENTWWYILNNPVKAGLTQNVEDYPYTWWRGKQ